MQDYTVTIKKKYVKNISIKIVSDKEVLLTLPIFVSKAKGLEFLDSKKAWIERKLLEFPKPLKIEDGEIFYYLGDPYTIKLYHDNRIKIDDKTIFIPYHDKERVLDKFLKKKSREVFEKLINLWEQKLDKKIQRVSIKKMKTRWGSCNTQKSYINLNLNLIHKPIKVIEYVVLHEMAHLTHPNHSKKFHSYVEKFMPDWKEREKLLKYTL